MNYKGQREDRIFENPRAAGSTDGIGGELDFEESGLSAVLAIASALHVLRHDSDRAYEDVKTIGPQVDARPSGTIPFASSL